MGQERAFVTYRLCRAVALCCASILAAAAPVLAAETSLSMNSEPGDYIGGGQSHYYDTQDGSFTADGHGGEIVSIFFQSSDLSHWWYLYFAAADGAPLAPGRYLFAARYPFQGPGQPGLSVYGDGRACGQLTGAFEVKRLVLDPNGAVLTFWAVFEQHCEGNAAALTGDIRFDADVAVAVKAPFTRRAPRGRSLTFDVSAADVGGAPVALTAEGLPEGSAFVDRHDGSGTFSWTPSADVALGPVDVRFRGDSGPGRTDVATTTIDVRGVTGLSMTSDPGDYIGAGLTYRYRDFSGTFNAYSSSANEVNVSFLKADHLESWFLGVAAPDAEPLAVSSYPGATRYPFEAPGVPGLSVSGNGRGCNMLSGRFDVMQLSRNPDGSVENFWATFEQHCEGGAPALYGEVQYNADVPPPLNHPPAVATGPDPRVECASFLGSLVSLDSSASTDADGDPLTFEWSAPGIAFDDPRSPTPSAEFPLGPTTVTLTVGDGLDFSTRTMVVNVVDTTPPQLAAVATPSTIGPPDHQLRDVSVAFVAQDACDPAPTVVLAAASSSEPARGRGRGDQAPDIVGAEIGTADTSVQLRAERSGLGPRRYKLTYIARDAAGNKATATAVVTVPGDASHQSGPRFSPAPSKPAHR